MVAAEPAAFVLDPALLMGATDTGLAVERVEAHVGAEQHPPVGLGAVTARTITAKHANVQVLSAYSRRRSCGPCCRPCGSAGIRT